MDVNIDLDVPPAAPYEPKDGDNINNTVTFNPRTMSPPKPPVHLFRVLAHLPSTSPPGTASYLCLPRSVPIQKPPRSKNAPKPHPTFSTAHKGTHRSFEALGDSAFTHQLPLLQHPSRTTTLTQSLNHTSTLTPAMKLYLPHLLIITMSNDTIALRKQCTLLETLHRDREKETSLYLCPPPIQSQFTASTASSWLASPPLFGATLRDLGERAWGLGGLPGYIVAYIFSAGMDALRYLHGSGYVHGCVGMQTLRANLHPSEFCRRWRGYPDIMLEDFGHAREVSEEGVDADVRGLLRVVRALVQRYSESAVFLDRKVAGDVVETDDGVVLLLGDVDALLAETRMLGVGEVREKVAERLDLLRSEAAVELAGQVRGMFHDDLVTVRDLDRVVKGLVVLKMRGKKRELAHLRDWERVEEGRCARVWKGRMLMVRFRKNKEGFRRAVEVMRGRYARPVAIVQLR